MTVVETTGPSQLARLIQNEISPVDRLEITADLFPVFEPWIAALWQNHLVLTGAKLADPIQADFLNFNADYQLSASAPLPNSSVLVPVTLHASSTSSHCVIAFALPPEWKIEHSFPDLPGSWRPSEYGEKILTLQNSLACELSVYPGAQLLLCSHDNDQMGFKSGLNLNAEVDARKVVAPFASLLGIHSSTRLRGYMAPATAAVKYSRIEWYLESTVETLAMGPIDLARLRCRLRTTEPEEAISPAVLFELGFRLPLDEAGNGLDLWARVASCSERWCFHGEPSGGPVDLQQGLDAIGYLFGTGDLELPDGLEDLGNIQLQGLSVEIDFARATISQFGLRIGSPTTWTVIPGLATARDLQLSWVVLQPFDSQRRYQSLGIESVLTFGSGKNAIRFALTFRQDHMSWFSGESILDEGQTLSLTDLIESVLPIPPDLPQISLSALYFSADSGGNYAIETRSPDVWELPVGIATLSFGQIAVALQHQSGEKGATDCTLSGYLAVGDDKFRANYQTPGEFAINGTLAEVSFTRIARTLIGDAIPFPDGFPELALQQVQLAISKKGKNYTLQLGAVVPGWGEAAVTVSKRASSQGRSEWGMVAGFVLPLGWKLSDLTGINAFDGFGFSNLALIAASFDDSGFSFSEQAVPGTFQLHEGVVFFANLSLEGGLLDSVKTVVGTNELRISAAMARQPRNSYLKAFLGDSVAIVPGSNLNLEGGGTGVALEIHPSPLSAAIAGELTVPLGKDSLRFVGRLMIGVNSLGFAAAAGAAEGSLPNPMGFQGITLNEIGVTLSVALDPLSLTLTLQGKFALKGQPPEANQFAMSFSQTAGVVHPRLLLCEMDQVDLPTLFNACMDGHLKLPAETDGVRFEKVELYWCDAPIPLPDGSTAQIGFGFNGAMDFFGWQAYARLMMDFSRGIEGDAHMDPIHLGDSLSITGQGESGGPLVHVSTSSSPFFAVSLSVELLDLVNNEVHGEIGDKGFGFTLEQNAFSFLDSTAHCRFSAAGHFEYASDMSLELDLDLALSMPGSGVSLGRIHVKGGYDGAIQVSLDPQRFAAAMAGGIAWLGKKWSVPPLRMSVAPSSFADFGETLLQHIVAEASEIFDALIVDAAHWAEWVATGLITGVDSLGRGLKEAYGQSAEAAAKILEGVGQSTAEVAGELKSAYRLSAGETAACLKKAGVAAEDTAKALGSAYGLGRDDAAKALKAADYAAEDVGRALKSTFNASSKEVSKAMQRAGYKAEETADVLKKVCGKNAKQTARILDESYDLGKKAMDSVLKGAGYSKKQVNNAIKDIGDALNPKNW